MNGDGEVLRRGWCNRWYRLQIRVIFVCYFGFKLRVEAFGFFVTGVLLLCFDVLKKILHSTVFVVTPVTDFGKSLYIRHFPISSVFLGIFVTVRPITGD